MVLTFKSVRLLAIFYQENIYLTNLGNSVAGKCQITWNEKEKYCKTLMVKCFLFFLKYKGTDFSKLNC